MSKDADSVDLTFGNWRKVYTGIRTSKKLNAVSIEAGYWYINLLLVVDDFGNTLAEWRYLAVTVYPMRDVTAAQAEVWTNEIVSVGLAVLYEVKGERYLHLLGFRERQKTKNGKPVRKHPAYPGEGGVNPDNPDESKSIQLKPVETKSNQINPVETSASKSRAEPESEKESEHDYRACVSPSPAQVFSSHGDALLALLRLGFSQDTADGLVTEHGLERIAWAVSRLVACGVRKKRNPAGYVRKVLQSPDGPSPPAPVLARLPQADKRQAALKLIRSKGQQ